MPRPFYKDILHSFTLVDFRATEPVDEVRDAIDYQALVKMIMAGKDHICGRLPGEPIITNDS